MVENNALKPQDAKYQESFERQRSSGILSFIIQFVLIGAVFFALGFTLGQKKFQVDRANFIPKIIVQNQTPPAEVSVDFSLFWQVFETLPKTYFDKSKIDGQKLLHGAISGMVRSLGDPYTAFLDPKQNESVKSELSGSYEGVGIQIGFNKEKRLVVIAPLSGTPAQALGVLPKDLILKIDKRETFDLTLPEAVDLIRGPAGTKVKLVLQHEGADESFDLEIERAKITVKSVEVKFENKDSKKIALIKVSRFGETTDREWDEAVNQVQLERASAVIVDMRNNPGGLLTSSVHLASDFIGGVVVKQEFADGSVKSLEADHKGELTKIPLVVIVNAGSASASEIFAGAIQDKNRGKIVGEVSFGKGTVQDAVELPQGAGLHVTVAKWLTPSGRFIHDLGIVPDIEVKMSAADVQNENDLQLSKALEIVI